VVGFGTDYDPRSATVDIGFKSTARISSRTPRPRPDLPQVHLATHLKLKHIELQSQKAEGADAEDPDEYRAVSIFWVPKEAEVLSELWAVACSYHELLAVRMR
jgi:hypothetical protein